MTILITGGTGLTGAEVARLLAAKGERPVLLDIAPRADYIADIKEKVRMLQGDISVWPEVMNAVKDNRVEGIFHLGAMMGRPSEQNPWASFRINVQGTMHILEAARLFGVKKVIFPSSTSTFALGAPEVVTDETIQRPTTFYASGKLYGELLGRFYRRKSGIDFRCLRYSTVMGPGVRLPSFTQFGNWMIKSAVAGKPYECFVSESSATPIIYIKDAARAAVMLYGAPADRIKTICYNVSGVEPAPSAKEIERAIKKSIPHARITYNPDPEVMEYLAAQKMKVIDDARAREEWGWQPAYGDLDGMVVDFIKEAKANLKLYGLA